MLHEKVFHVTKKLVLHKKSISCRQKQDNAAPKKYFLLKKVINFFRNGAPYLLALIEKWEKNLDDKGYGGAVLMDMSKAFDTLNHDLLIANLSAYGFEHDALKLIYSYLINRWHRTKINSAFGSCEELTQWVPQGSVLGSLLFNPHMHKMGPRRRKHYIFGNQFYSKNARRLRFQVFIHFNARKHMLSSFYLKWIEFIRNCKFVPI